MVTKLYSPNELANFLKVSRRTLGRWHLLRKGPPRFSVGNSVFYRKSAVEAWVIANETNPVKGGY
jgi:hypothetical protein